jgi:hypothetical protein
MPCWNEAVRRVFPVTSLPRLARRRSLAFGIALGLALASPAARSESLRYCDAPTAQHLASQAHFLNLAAAVSEALQQTGARIAVVSRDGLDLTMVDQRYSHAGFALRQPDGRWTVRQLYFSCDEGRPRIFDQGLAGFLAGTLRPDRGFVRVVLLPPSAAQRLAAAVTDDRLSLAMLHPIYSANAHAFSTAYQNCNQWVVEMMAAAWGGVADRAGAQAWLAQDGYQASRLDLPSLILRLLPLSPWLHLDDHPPQDLEQTRMRVSLPEGLEQWLLARYPQARVMELCNRGTQLVIRRGVDRLDEACNETEDDIVWQLP